MANYSNLKTAIENAVDWNNGDNEITGQNLLDILETIIDSLGAKYKFADVATPSSSISTPDEPLFYLAGAGTYANFSGLTVSVQRGTLAIFYYDTAWHWTSVRTDSDAFFNVNQYLEAPSTTYTKATGRNAVPEALRSKGMIITYLTTNGWIIEQNLSTSGTWNADANWQTIGPVSVSQNTETGDDTLSIGNNSYRFANADKLIKLKRIGIFGNPTDLVVGDVIYSTPLGKIIEVLAINESQVVSNYREIPFMKGAIYQCYGTLYIYDETEQTIVPIIKLEKNGEKITLTAGTGISQTLASGKVADLVSLINNYSFTWKDGYYLTRLNGELTDVGYSYCDYVPVLPNTKLYLYANFAGITSYCFYDKYKNFLSGSRNETGNDQFDGLIDTPESAAYIRISSKIGEKGKVILFNSVLKTLSDIAGADINKLSKDNEYTQGNKLDWNYGYFLTNTNAVTSNEGYAYCDYIPVVPLSKVHIKAKFTANAAFCFYDKNQTFIVGYKNQTGTDVFDAVVDVPINANYLRISSEYSAVAIADVATLIVSSLSNKEEMFASVATFENFVTMGDSYGAGAILKNSSVTDTISVSWGKQLERLVGSECFNCCRGGQWTGGFLTDQLQGSLNQVLNLGVKKLYFYCLGINDAIRIAQGTHTLGTIDDIKDDYTQNPATFYGNYGKIIAQVLDYAPDAMHVVCTVGLTTANCPELAGVNPDIDSINTALIAIANKFSIPCIILNNDAYFGSSYYINGLLGGHPTAVQYGGYAKAMERLFAACVLNNYNYFKVYIG